MHGGVRGRRQKPPPTRSAIGTDVYSYVEAMYAHWVVDGGVEDEWDSYIDQLNAMGLEELVSLQQGAYAAYLESME